MSIHRLIKGGDISGGIVTVSGNIITSKVSGEVVKGVASKELVAMMNVSGVAAGAWTALTDCSSVDLDKARSLAVTVEGRYGASGCIVHVVSSPDGTDWDTSGQDYTIFEPTFLSGISSGCDFRYTKAIEPSPRYIKTQVEAVAAISGVIVRGIIGKYY